VLARRGPAVVETEFGQTLGGGLHEFRLRWPAEDVWRTGSGRNSGPCREEICCARLDHLNWVMAIHHAPRDPVGGGQWQAATAR
jgi:hypothetical protein